MAEKRLKIDWQKVDKLLEAGCLGTEVAGVIGIPPDLLYDRCLSENGVNFSEYRQKRVASGDAILRAKQYQTAMKGNVPMQIFLGKNRLNQSDRVEQKVEASVTSNIKVVLPEPLNPITEGDKKE